MTSFVIDRVNGVDHSNLTSISEWVMILMGSVMMLTMAIDIYQIKQVKILAMSVDSESGRAETYKNDNATVTNC